MSCLPATVRTPSVARQRVTRLGHWQNSLACSTIVICAHKYLPGDFALTSIGTRISTRGTRTPPYSATAIVRGPHLLHRQPVSQSSPPGPARDIQPREFSPEPSIESSRDKMRRNSRGVTRHKSLDRAPLAALPSHKAQSLTQPCQTCSPPK